MANFGPTTDAVPAPALSRFTEAVDAADTLLYYAVSTGQELPGAVRDPIINARATAARGESLTKREEGEFLDAYAKLAMRVAPVTAATLAATNPRFRERRWFGRSFGVRMVSDAQHLALRFGIIAVLLIAAIAAGEWTRALIGSIRAAQKVFDGNALELSENVRRLNGIDKQIEMLAPAAATPDTPNTGAVREALRNRQEELKTRINALERANNALNETIEKGLDSFQRLLLLGPEKLEHVGSVLAGFLLPVIYGALGTCAFVMRSLFREMADRTFGRRRTSEYMVRIFLGMLSGLTLQWLVVRADGTVAGGVTPAVLAFLGGYSVEMLFATMDRLVQTVSGRGRPANRGPASMRSKRERSDAAQTDQRRPRLREVAGSAAAARASSPVAPLPMRAEPG